MTKKANSAADAAWQDFVIAYGWRSPINELSAAIGKESAEVLSFRKYGVCNPLPSGKRFAELFHLWHGRPPTDVEWPAPRMFASRGHYEWQPPELKLLASLVGQFGIREISKLLTARLRAVTSDPGAARNKGAVQLTINRIGLQTSDVVGGITVSDAAREVGSRPVVVDAIRQKKLRAVKVGRLLVIPHADWASWKEKRSAIPDGFVLLRGLKEPLSVRSDKLSEFARMGYVPTAIRCKPFGVPGPSTQFGTWYLSKEVAEKLLADRRRGLPMPWHGKPLMDNLKVTFTLWQTRQHPKTCETCSQIWGKSGAPKAFNDYLVKYPHLEHGAKRHLTMPWTPGLTLQDVAKKAKCSVKDVGRAIKGGALNASLSRGRRYVSKTDCTRWIYRGKPDGSCEISWVSMATAAKRYGFSNKELRQFIADKKLKTKIGDAGAMRGIKYVSRHQCAMLREKIGYTERQAAKKLGISVDRFREVLSGVNWRKAERIPLVTVQAVFKRLKSNQGHTIEEAAEILGTTSEWINARKDDGTIRIFRAKWSQGRLYVSAPNLERLRVALKRPAPSLPLPPNWVRLSAAAHEAGVSNVTLEKWAIGGEVEVKSSSNGMHYDIESVRSRAREYWATSRFIRPVLPGWLKAEKSLSSAAG